MQPWRSITVVGPKMAGPVKKGPATGVNGRSGKGLKLRGKAPRLEERALGPVVQGGTFTISCNRALKILVKPSVKG